METGLKRFQRRASSRNNADRICDVVAIAVGIPNRILIGARDLPGHLIPGCRLLRPYRRPGAKLTRYNWRAAIFQLRASPAADAIEKEILANLGQAGLSERLDHSGGGGRNADHSVAIEVLVETDLQRSQCSAIT